MNTLKTSALLASCLLTIAGCMKDEVTLDDPTYNRSLNFASPVFNVTADYVSIFNSLSLVEKKSQQTKITADENGWLYVDYTTDYQLKWNSILGIGAYDDNYSLPLPTVAQTSFDQELNFPHKLNSDSTIRIDSICLNGATLSLKIGALPVSGIATITFNELTDNGKIFSDNWTISEGLDKSYDLSGYLMKPTHSGDSSLIICKLQMVGTCTKTATNDFNIAIKMDDITPKIAFGFFGTREVVNNDDDSNIKFFTEFDVPRSVHMKGMHIKLDVDNLTGTPFDLSMENMRLVSAGGDTLQIEFMDSNTVFVDQIAYTDYNSNGNTPKSNSYLLDSTNSNVDVLLNSSPVDYKYNLKIVSNPKGEVQENFITPETELDVTVNVFIPFWAKVDNLNRQDTFEFIFNDLILDEDNVKYIDTMIVAMKFSNGLPFAFYSQGYLVDKNYSIVDSLFPKQKKLWQMPKFDKDLRVSERAVSETEAIFDNEKIKKCSEGDVKYLIMANTVSTNDMPDKYFRLYKDYGIDMRIAIELIGKYTNE